MKYIFTLLFALTLLTACSQEKLPVSQNLRDSVLVNSDIFTILYSEKFEQPIWIKYNVKCPSGTASRTGMDFYANDSIHTSDNADYANNDWDKGHMAPAASFNCTREMLYKTFTYLNCSLQNQYLNRGVWRLLEARERELAKIYNVSVFIRVEFSTLTLRTGARLPLSYHKQIAYNGITECYFFKNERPASSKLSDHICK
jgi:endonuclease G